MHSVLPRAAGRAWWTAEARVIGGEGCVGPAAAAGVVVVVAEGAATSPVVSVSSTRELAGKTYCVPPPIVARERKE